MIRVGEIIEDSSQAFTTCLYEFNLIYLSSYQKINDIKENRNV